MAGSAQAGEALIRNQATRARHISSAAAILAAALCALRPLSLAAQATVPPATSLSTDDALRQQISFTGTNRSYRVGESTVSENVANARYELNASRTRLRLEGAVLRFAAPSATIDGSLPLAARVDFATRPGDTITAFVRSASRPNALTARETSALSTAGTSTVDLESFGLGAPAVGGLRVALAFPLGDLVLATRAGIEMEPRPSGTLPVYWRGTTARGGVALTGSAGEGTLTGSMELTHSSGDSLGGRNLFPGGGSLTLQLSADASVTNPFDPLDDEQWPVRAVAFYGRPFGNERADQPNLIIPRGDLFGALATLLVPFGDLTAAPSLQLVRESSASESGSGLQRNRVTGTAWTAQLGLDVAIPLGDRFELTPQAGYTFGSVGATFAQTAVIRRGRGLVQSSSFTDPIRGHWISMQLTARF